MHNTQYTLSHLFAQLGLPAEAQQIEDFITARRPLANGVALYRAPFWSPAQRAFSGGMEFHSDGTGSSSSVFGGTSLLRSREH